VLNGTQHSMRTHTCKVCGFSCTSSATLGMHYRQNPTHRPAGSAPAQQRMTDYFYCPKCYAEIHEEGLCASCAERCAERVRKHRLELERRVAALPNLLENAETETQT
jgi:hypothetical protein